MRKVVVNVSVLTLLAVTSLAASAGLYTSSPYDEQLIVSALQLDVNVDRGKILYRSQCVACHGSDAQGDGDKQIPSLAAQRRPYLIKQLADFATRNRDATRMHSIVARPLVRKPQAWADLAGYLNGEQSVVRPQTGDGKLASLGEASYQQWCSSCHEEDARGDDDGFVPSLRNQHYSYLLGELRAISAGHRFAMEPDLMRFFASLDDGEMQGLADYLSRKSGSVRNRDRLMEDGTVSE